MIRYAITAGHLRTTSSTAEIDALVQHALHLAQAGVDYLQIREKSLTFARAADLAQQALYRVRAAGLPMHILVNAPWPPPSPWPVDVGLHLSTPSLAQLGTDPSLPSLVSASCHTLHELNLARPHATLLLFAPVFQKQVDGLQVQPGQGLQQLASICKAAAPLPVLAMGGVTPHNAQQCLDSGAAGIAGIRLFSAQPVPAPSP